VLAHGAGTERLGVAWLPAPSSQVRYGIGSPITARRLTGGYANDVLRLDADGPPTVLHLKHPRSTPTA
jgi:hypothetical protein